jgi:subtilisin-like proprotein convertase family protein
MAARWRLPGGRWVNSTERSLKAHMKNTRTGVVVGMAFFYQSWNHGRSPLPTNAQYQRQGYVLYPNDDDRRMSQEPSRSAGHAILLIGWDDDLRVQRVNADGSLMVDADGNAVYDQGFFLFKNSWGTGRFGVENEFGAGYGWISYRYISEYGTAYTSSIPRCNDASPDCNDPLCRARGLCDMPMPTAREYSNTMAVSIPDDDAAGIASTIDVPDAGRIRTASITVDITHPYRGDLVIRLDRTDGEPIVLFDREGGSADDVQRSWDLPQLAGTEASGPWTLEVVDTAGQDVGTLNSWTIRLETETPARP